MRSCLNNSIIALIFLIAPGPALHALNAYPDGGDDSKPAAFAFGNVNLTQAVSESFQYSDSRFGIGDTAAEAPTFFAYPIEHYNTGWGIVLDNDALVSRSRDRDYTGGFAVTLSGARVAEFRLSLDPALSWINKKLHLDGSGQQATINHSMQIGLVLFTPDLDTVRGTKFATRPFANLLFVENSQFRTNASKNRAHQTTFGLGLLGTNVGEFVQNEIHRVGGNSKASGFSDQISDGGELTARYAMSMESLLQSRFTGRGTSFELKYRVGADIGYITEGSATLAARWGQFESPWWSFAPTRSNYLPQIIPVSRGYHRASAGRDFFMWSAITVRARAYNAFLQGQFRDSEITYSGGELNHLLCELSFGLARRFGNDVNVSLAIHYQTNEIKNDKVSKKIRWGGLTIHKIF